MRTYEDVLNEFENDFDNAVITNETLDKRYSDICKKHIKDETISEEDKEKFKALNIEIKAKIKERHDFYLDINEKLLKLQEDIIKGYRVFTVSRSNDGKVEMEDIIIKFPGIVDDEEIELACSKLYNKLLQDGDMLTESEIIEQLSKRNIWSKEKEKELEDKRETWKELNLKLNREKLKTRKRNLKVVNELNKKTKEAEQAYDELNNFRNKHVTNSIEMRVEELRLRSKLYKCVRRVKEVDGKKVPGEPYWKNVDELKNDPKSFIYQIFDLAQYYWNGVDPSFLQEPLSDVEGGEVTEEIS